MRSGLRRTAGLLTLILVGAGLSAALVLAVLAAPARPAGPLADAVAGAAGAGSTEFRLLPAFGMGQADNRTGPGFARPARGTRFSVRQEGHAAIGL